MINHVRNTVLTILNKENRGYLTPEQFNLYAQHAQQNIFNLYFSEYSRMSTMKNARRLSQDYGDRVRDLKNKIDKFTTVVQLPKKDSVYLKPCDMYMPLSLRCNGVEVDEVPVYKFEFLTFYFTALVQYEISDFWMRPGFPGRPYAPSSSHIHFFKGYVTVDAHAN